MKAWNGSRDESLSVKSASLKLMTGTTEADADAEGLGAGFAATGPEAGGGGPLDDDEPQAAISTPAATTSTLRSALISHLQAEAQALLGQQRSPRARPSGWRGTSW